MNSHIHRGDYDCCRVPVAWQLSPYEIGEANSGEDNSKLEPKKLRKFKPINMVKQEVLIEAFRHAESISLFC